jgi:hypothetical protein
MATGTLVQLLEDRAREERQRMAGQATFGQFATLSPSEVSTTDPNLTRLASRTDSQSSLLLGESESLKKLENSPEELENEELDVLVDRLGNLIRNVGDPSFSFFEGPPANESPRQRWARAFRNAANPGRRLQERESDQQLKTRALLQAAPHLVNALEQQRLRRRDPAKEAALSEAARLRVQREEWLRRLKMVEDVGAAGRALKWPDARIQEMQNSFLGFDADVQLSPEEQRLKTIQGLEPTIRLSGGAFDGAAAQRMFGSEIITDEMVSSIDKMAANAKAGDSSPLDITNMMRIAGIHGDVWAKSQTIEHTPTRTTGELRIDPETGKRTRMVPTRFSQDDPKIVVDPTASRLDGMLRSLRQQREQFAGGEGTLVENGTLDQLDGMIAVLEAMAAGSSSPAPDAGSNLTPEEQAALDALEKDLGGSDPAPAPN